MSRNGSMKEAILGIYLKERPKIISEVLGFEVHHMALEQKHGAYHVDVKAVDKKRRIPVLFELQVKPANKAYLNRVKKMITSTQEGVIVWVAREFDKEMINELQHWLKGNQSSYVDFYAITLNSEVIPILQQLNDMYKLEIYENLHLLDEVEARLSIVLQSERIPPSHCGHLIVDPPPLIYELDQDIKHGLLLHLRKKIPQFLNFHYDKKANQYDKILNIGAGKYGVVYRCSAIDRRGKAYIELYFDKCLTGEYDAFKEQKSLLQKKIHPELICNKRRIGVYFTPEDTHEQTFEKITEIFRNMIKTFSPYFYGGKPIELLNPPDSREEMISHHLLLFEERDFETEDSYRIRMESLGERFSAH
ncbi:hypothetical protein [Solibacillus merdavium]|uniref:Protein kinase domain-containing protein n=1 Tax=Solibacillus merdavium TaxID=2762218 RepID=A0ABR8XRL4_9BACL|nr:hypothetical protein [Solibacillus merdavium]MBD8034595.1 hypothetical protein [Solibacillus merdavium]